MAKLRVEGLSEAIEKMLSVDVGKMTDEMIKAAEPVLVNELRSRVSAHNRTGALSGSIKSTGIKQKGSGKYLVVRPTGVDSKGVRNMEKLAYLEYGTCKQKATPVLVPAVNSAETKVQAAFERIMNSYLEKVSL